MMMLMMIECCDHSFFLVVYKLVFIWASFETIDFYSCYFGY